MKIVTRAARAARTVAAGITLLLFAVPVAAQQSTNREDGQSRQAPADYPPVYRVEVIVFSHVDGRSDRIRSKAPAEFAGRLDPLVIARANASAELQLAGLSTILPVARIPGEIDETTPYLATAEETLRPIPPVYSALGDLSVPIQRAMNRLFDAPEYEPVAARAWIQLARRGRRTAAVRIHDQNVVDLIEPEQNESLVPVAHVLPFGPLVETPPPALDIYRLDGTLRLRQRQFLHLDLDLVWQTPARAVADRGVLTDTSTRADSTTSGDKPTDKPGRPETTQSDWQIHRLQQSRVVRPGRLEYFDSSLFGVLVRVERFEQVVPEIRTPVQDPAGANDPESAEIGDPVTISGR